MVDIIDDEKYGWLKAFYNDIFLKIENVIIRWVLPVTLLVIVAPAVAGKWEVSKRLNLSEIYSSNIGLTSFDEEDDLVTRVRPGLSINGAGRRLDLNFDYEPELLAYSKGPSRKQFYNRLKSDVVFNIVPEALRLDGNAGIRQIAVDTNARARLINKSLADLADVVTLNVGTSLFHDFSGYLVSDLSFRYGTVDYQGIDLPDSELGQAALTFGSGRHFRRLTWTGGYSKNTLKRTLITDSRRESANISLRYKVSRTLVMLARGGYENNRFKSSRNIINGAYSGAGLAWNPSKYISLDASYGDRSNEASLMWTPLVRTNIRIAYFDRAVGVKTGSVWSSSLSHSTRRTKWQASYLEDVSNLQRLDIIGEQAFVQFDAQGNLVTDPITGIPVIVTTDVFGLTDEEFLRKRANISYTLTAGKNMLSFSPYRESREYEVSGNKEDVLGTVIAWDWRFAPKTRSVFSLNWQDRKFNTANRDDALWRISLGLYKDLRPGFNASVEYHYLERNSMVQSNEYRENQLQVNISKQFQRR